VLTCQAETVSIPVGGTDRADPVACVSTRRSNKRGMHSGPEFVGLYRQRQPGPPNLFSQLPTQNSYRWNLTPLILFDGGRGGRI